MTNDTHVESFKAECLLFRICHDVEDGRKGCQDFFHHEDYCIMSQLVVQEVTMVRDECLQFNQAVELAQHIVYLSGRLEMPEGSPSGRKLTCQHLAIFGFVVTLSRGDSVCDFVVRPRLLHLNRLCVYMVVGWRKLNDIRGTFTV